MADDDIIANSVIDDNIEYAFSTNTKNMAVMVQQGIQASGAYNPDYKCIDVLPQDPEYIGFNLYLYKELAETTVAIATAINDKTITVTSATGAVVGDSINIRENAHVFQSVIKAINGNIITFASPIDYAFTTAAVVYFGEWNLNINGSVTPQVFRVRPPANAKFHISSVSISITDDASMDDGKFGSLTALTNGLVCRRVNGSTSNYFLITNNAGFFQAGYDKTYPDKVPAGVYSLNARKKMMEVNGSVIALDGATQDEFQIIVQDNLTGLSEFTVQVHGHIVEG